MTGPEYLRARPRRPLDVRIRQALLSHVDRVYIGLLALLLLVLGLATNFQAARSLAGFILGGPR